MTPSDLVFRSLLVWSGALALALYLATLLTQPPFSPGQLLGRGFLLGSVLMVLSLALVGRTQRGLRSSIAAQHRGSEHNGEDSVAAYLDPLLTLGLMFLLCRLFLEQVPAPRAMDVAAHYTYVGLALGALTPFLWMAYNLRTRHIAGLRFQVARGGQGSC